MSTYLLFLYPEEPFVVYSFTILYCSIDLSFSSKFFFFSLNNYSRSSSDLRKNIETLEKNGVNSLKTMVNLGSEVYMQAEV